MKYTMVYMNEVVWAQLQRHWIVAKSHTNELPVILSSLCIYAGNAFNFNKQEQQLFTEWVKDHRGHQSIFFRSKVGRLVVIRFYSARVIILCLVTWSNMVKHISSHCNRCIEQEHFKGSLFIGRIVTHTIGQFSLVWRCTHREKRPGSVEVVGYLASTSNN